MGGRVCFSKGAAEDGRQGEAAFDSMGAKCLEGNQPHAHARANGCDSEKLKSCQGTSEATIRVDSTRDVGR